MTQNVDLQVKVKFVVDPKDLQNALSGGVGGGGGGVAAAAGTKGGAAPGAAGLHMPGSNIPRIALPPGFMSQMQALTRALTAQTVALNSRTRELISSKNSELKVEGQIARFKVQEELAEDKRHRSEMKRRADRMQEVLDAENLAKRIDTERKRRLDKAAQDEAQSLRKSQLSARRVGKGYGSEGMFAAGTSPIMQGLAWQSLFATGDILGPMAFAPMALYQNFSLRRQRRNRGFDLGAGSDLAKAAGVGDTGQIATAGHALAALRANTALAPEERERRMAQVDIMSAGRVRGRLGRGIEMFESGQLGGKGMQALGARVGALGGVSSVALGAAAGLGAIAIAGLNVEKFLSSFAVQLQEATEAARASGRAARLSLQEKAAGDLPVAARKAALEKYGMLSTPERFQGSALRLLQRGMSKDSVTALMQKAEAAESAGVGISADKILEAAAQGGGPLAKRSVEQQYEFAGRRLVASGDLARQSLKEFNLAPSASRPTAGSVGAALRHAQAAERRGAEITGRRFAGELAKGADRNYAEIIAPGKKANDEAIAVLEAKLRILGKEMETTSAFMMFMQDVGILLGGEGSAATRALRTGSEIGARLETSLGDRQ